IRVVAGREFTDRDIAGATPVALIDETLARRYFAGTNPVGRRLVFGTSDMRPRPHEIVGVVGHVKHDGFDEGSGDLQFYYPIGHAVNESGAALVARTAGDPIASVRLVESAMQQVDEDRPLYQATTMTRNFQANQAGRRFVAALVGAFAAVSTLLAA